MGQTEWDVWQDGKRVADWLLFAIENSRGPLPYGYRLPVEVAKAAARLRGNRDGCG
jgi:hypothetical protein